jgi:hypothetical protein
MTNASDDPQPAYEPSPEVLEKCARLGLPSPLESTAAFYYYGFDRSTYPGDAVMQDWWITTPMFWTGFY